MRYIDSQQEAKKNRERESIIA